MYSDSTIVNSFGGESRNWVGLTYAHEGGGDCDSWWRRVQECIGTYRTG